MPFPQKTKRKAAPSDWNKVSTRLHEFPQSIFLFHCRLLTSSANLRFDSTSVSFAAMFYYNLVQNSVGTRSHPTAPLSGTHILSDRHMDMVGALALAP